MAPEQAGHRALAARARAAGRRRDADRDPPEDRARSARTARRVAGPAAAGHRSRLHQGRRRAVARRSSWASSTARRRRTSSTVWPSAIPIIAEEVKNLLFVFEDIINLDDRAIQRILKEVEGKDLALALKTANDELLQRVYKNMSTRAASTLREDIEVLGPVRMREVGKAQQNIVDVIRTLEENGQIVISRGGKDERLV